MKIDLHLHTLHSDGSLNPKEVVDLAVKRNVKIPDNVLVLKGKYCDQIENQKKYTKEERIVRDNQMFLDFLFKYLRTKNSEYLDKLDKYGKSLK